MSKKAAAAGGWPVRPFDAKCREFEPVDADTVTQIRAFIDGWDAHDWPAVRAVLEVEVPAAASRLATLTVRDVRLLFNSLAYRGHGQRHTAHTAVVSLGMPLPAQLADDVAWYSAHCNDHKHGRILSTLLDGGHTNRGKPITMTDVNRLVGTPNNPADLSRPRRLLTDRGLVHAKQANGLWLTPRGEALARHLAARKSSVQIVRLSAER
jgi:hypothetical protein